MTRVRVAILGAGAMGTAHAAAYAGIDDAKVVGVFSRNPDRARAVAAICHAEPFTDPDALMAAADAIDVCLPSNLHHEFVVPALNAGKHVFCRPRWRSSWTGPGRCATPPATPTACCRSDCSCARSVLTSISRRQRRQANTVGC